MTQDIIFFLFYFILLFFQNEDTTAMRLQADLHDGPDPSKNCEHCDGPSEKPEKETRMNFTKEKKSKYFQRLSNFYKFKFSGKLRYNYSLSKGWGATGMPFNVLYSPNAYQQKILKSVTRKEQTGRYSEPRKNVPEVYNLILEDEKPPPKTKERLTKSQNSPRKYYSLIPQLFVSYGW